MNNLLGILFFFLLVLGKDLLNDSRIHIALSSLLMLCLFVLQLEEQCSLYCMAIKYQTRAMLK